MPRQLSYNYFSLACFFKHLLIVHIFLFIVKGQICPPLILPPYGEFAITCNNRIGSRCYIGCISGYELVGSCNRKCCENGQWTGSDTQCINRGITCPVLPNHLSVTSPCPRIAGTYCQVQCNNQNPTQFYTQLFCDGNGSWIPSPNSLQCNQSPSCSTVSCYSLTAPVMGSMSGSCSPGVCGQFCSFTCSPPYTLFGSSQIRCMENGSWSDSSPICRLNQNPLTCDEPLPKIENGGPHLGQCTPGQVGMECIFSCAPGFALSGIPNWLCQTNGKWNKYPLPNCVPIRCNMPPTVEHGYLGGICNESISAIPMGTICPIKCNENYKLNSCTPNAITCETNGSWNVSTPLVCELTQCDFLIPPSNGFLNGTCAPGLSGKTCTVTCLNGYVLRDGPKELTCTGNGTWSNNLGHCEQLICAQLPDISNGTKSGICAQTDVVPRPGQMCAYQCNENFDLLGTAVLECLPTGLWSSTIPSCVASSTHTVVCAPLPMLECALISGQCTDAMPGAICRYVCEKPAQCSGSVNLTCGNDGRWTGGPMPSCVNSLKNCRSIRKQPGLQLSGQCRPGIPGMECQIFCSTGYVLKGVHSLICMSSGAWSNAVPRCVRNCGCLQCCPKSWLSNLWPKMSTNSKYLISNEKNSSNLIHSKSLINKSNTKNILNIAQKEKKFISKKQKFNLMSTPVPLSSIDSSHVTYSSKKPPPFESFTRSSWTIKDDHLSRIQNNFFIYNNKNYNSNTLQSEWLSPLKKQISFKDRFLTNKQLKIARQSLLNSQSLLGQSISLDYYEISTPQRLVLNDFSNFSHIYSLYSNPEKDY